MLRRKAILDAASDLFSERGYRAVSTREIAQAANVNESTLFRLFESKQEIARAVWCREVEALSAPLARPKIHDVRLAAQTYAHWYLQHVGERQIRLWAVLSIEAPTCVEMGVLPAHVSMAEALREAQKAGTVINGDPEELMQVLHCALFGRVMRNALRHPIAGACKSRDDISTLLRVWTRGISC